jgi:hypothetical protein
MVKSLVITAAVIGSLFLLLAGWHFLCEFLMDS